MKPLSGKTKHRYHRLGPIHRFSCNLSTVMISSALFFFLGVLKGSLLTWPQESGKTTKGAVKAEEQPKKEQSRSALEVTQQVELPLHKPFEHGETGSPQVEHIAFQVLSWSPRAYIFPKFADNETCDNIIALAKRSMAPSGLALKPEDREEDQKDVRTSTGAFFFGRDDPSGALSKVERKMSLVTAVPVEHGEAFNILRYSPGQQYQAHMDTFDPKDYGTQETNRIASFLLYLSDVEEGGETAFPHEGGITRTQRFDECVGLKVKPRKGDALLFWSMTPMRKIDPDALHAGCPVIKGEKWVATKWLRDGFGG